MVNLPYHLIISGNFFQFEEPAQLEELVEILFCHASDRREFYEKIVLDCASVASKLIEEAGEEGEIRSSSLISGVKIIVDKYGRVYDPGKEIMKISCEEGL